LQYGKGFDFIKLAAPLPTNPSSPHDFGVIHTGRLPASGPELCSDGEKENPGQAASSAGVTLTVEQCAVVKIDTITYFDPAKRTFRAVRLPASATTPAIDGSLGLELVYGLAPIRTRICPAAKLTVPNGPGWNANAEVEFFIHGVDVPEYFSLYGGWTKVSEGSVSADGNTVSTNDGEGLPELGVVGIRLKTP